MMYLFQLKKKKCSQPIAIENGYAVVSSGEALYYVITRPLHKPVPKGH